MTFISTWNDGALNLSEVSEIRAGHGGNNYAVLKDGSTVRVYESPDEVVMMTSRVVPATPGFELLVAYEGDGDDFWVDRTPIVAWRLNGWGESYVDPVAIEGRANNAFESAIKTPNGQMIHPTSARWPSEKEWNDELPKMLAKHKRIRTSIAEMKAQKDAAA